MHFNSCKKISNKNGMMFLIATVITSIIVLTFGIKNDALYYSLALIILLLVITSFAFYVPKKKLLNLNIPTRVIISGDTISTLALGGKSPIKTVSLSKIKKIIDAGDWYEIIFKHGNICNSWVCQKDLIVEGTIDEFEQLFHDKIVRQ